MEALKIVLPDSPIFPNMGPPPLGSTSLPRPFLKWPGGKRRMATALIACMPKSFNTYFDPFIGGGAMFFSLRPMGAYISDLNPEVINVYNMVKHKVRDLIAAIGGHEVTRKNFMQLRNLDRSDAFESLSDVQRAARFIKLNKTCFGGNMRYNKAGQLTIGYGHLNRRRLYDEAALLACHEQLRCTRVWSGCFSMLEELPRAGGLVFFDPPYAFAKGGANTSVIEYTKEKFDMDMQLQLRDLCCELNARGVHIMVTNTDCDLVRDLYSDFVLKKVAAPYSISQNSSKRGLKQELLATNY